MSVKTTANTIVLWLLALAAPVAAVPRGKLPPRHPERTTSVRRTLRRRRRGADAVGRPDASCQARGGPLVYNGGALMLNPQVVLMYWGSEWNTPDAEHTAVMNALASMFGQIGSSGFACAWQEYSVPGMTFGNGTYDSSADIVTAAPSNPLLDADIQAQIVIEVNAHRLPMITDNRLYVVVPPKGIPVEAGRETGCGGTNFTFCGYHSDFQPSLGTNVRYAVLPYPCSTNVGTCFEDLSEDPALALEHVGSHELTEAATDPDGDGWTSRGGNENADICASFRCDFDLAMGPDTFLINPAWSNLAKGCVATVPCAAPAVACTDTAPGVCVPGSGKGHECEFEWLVYPNLGQRHSLPGKTISCPEGNSFCDFDGTQNGVCTFHIAGCLNSVDPRVTCTPADITSLHLGAPSPTSSDPTAATSAETILSALKTADSASAGTISGAVITYSPAAGTQNACTSYLDIHVPTRTGGTRTVAGRQTIVVTLKTAGGPARQSLTLVCLPPS